MITEKRGSFTIRKQDPEEEKMQIKNPVYLTKDRNTAVPEGHPDAAFLLVGRNGHLSTERAKQYGVTENGAPGQKIIALKVHHPAGVNENVRDGVNTHPESPAAIVVKTGDKAPEQPAKAPEAPAKAPERAPKVKTPKTPKAPRAKKTGKVKIVGETSRK
jgi:hypothetical protein